MWNVEVRSAGSLVATVTLNKAVCAGDAIHQAATKLDIPTDTKITIVVGKDKDDKPIFDHIYSTPPQYCFEARQVTH